MVDWIAPTLDLNLVKVAVVVIVWICFKTCQRWLIRQLVTVRIVENTQTEGETDVHTAVVGCYGVVGHWRCFGWNTSDDTRFTASCRSTEGKTCRQCRFNRPETRLHTGQVWHEDEVGLVDIGFEHLCFNIVDGVTKRLCVQDVADTIVITIERCAHVILRIGSTSKLTFIRPTIVVIVHIENQVGRDAINKFVRITITICIQPSGCIVWEGIRSCNTDASRQSRCSWSVTDAITIGIGVHVGGERAFSKFRLVRQAITVNIRVFCITESVTVQVVGRC